MDTTHPDSKVVLEGTVEPGYERVKQAFGDLVEKGNFCAKSSIMMFWEGLVASREMELRVDDKSCTKIAAN